ncbi:MAG: hypothetical protein K2L38_12080 [Dysosmobacter sp.]|nr:hypothetical protein [Dysosmobacter sp.]
MVLVLWVFDIAIGSERADVLAVAPLVIKNLPDFLRCKTFLENINRKQALAYGLWATGRRFFYILWKFCGVDFQNRLFVR